LRLFLYNRCEPCLKAAPDLSEIAEKHAGKVAVVGVNNEAMFEDKEQNVEQLKEFLAENKAAFRYTNVIDKENHARESKFSLFSFFLSLNEHGNYIEYTCANKRTTFRRVEV
jgi:thiol-disulfide isomerase/thioredoxin